MGLCLATLTWAERISLDLKIVSMSKIINTSKFSPGILSRIMSMKFKEKLWEFQRSFSDGH